MLRQVVHIYGVFKTVDGTQSVSRIELRMRTCDTFIQSDMHIPCIGCAPYKACEVQTAQLQEGQDSDLCRCAESIFRYQIFGTEDVKFAITVF